jgi:hypothetical protein
MPVWRHVLARCAGAPRPARARQLCAGRSPGSRRGGVWRPGLRSRLLAPWGAMACGAAFVAYSCGGSRGLTVVTASRVPVSALSGHRRMAPAYGGRAAPRPGRRGGGTPVIAGHGNGSRHSLDPGAQCATAPRPAAAPGATARGAEASRPDGRRPPFECRTGAHGPSSEVTATDRGTASIRERKARPRPDRQSPPVQQRTARRQAGRMAGARRLRAQKT